MLQEIPSQCIVYIMEKSGVNWTWIKTTIHILNPNYDMEDDLI